ncbi:lebercilin, partial [Elysia marginata]
MSTYSGRSRESPGRYSDDFVSDEDRQSESTPLRKDDPSYYHDRLRGGRGRGAISRGRGRGQLQGRRRGGLRGRGNSRNSEPADMRRLDNVTTRVMSASRNKINELRNKVEELRLKMKDLEQENKLYKKLQYRQEKAIRTFEDKENDLPNIIDKHNNEVRSLKEQNRRLKEKHDKTDRYLRDAEDELERVKKKMIKYKKMCDEKELPEREELARKVTKAELDMEEKDVRIKELQRHIESLKKNHRHELGIEAARQRELKRQLEEAADRTASLENVVK